MVEVDQIVRKILEVAASVDDIDERIAYLTSTIDRVEREEIYPGLELLAQSEVVWSLKEEILGYADAREALHGNHALRLRVGSYFCFVLHEYVAPWDGEPFIFCKVLKPDGVGEPVDRRDEMWHDTYYRPDGAQFPPFTREEGKRNYSLCKPLNDEEVRRLEVLRQSEPSESRLKTFYAHLFSMYHQWYQAHEQTWPDPLANQDENEKEVTETHQYDHRINLFYIQYNQTVEQSESPTEYSKVPTDQSGQQTHPEREDETQPGSDEATIKQTEPLNSPNDDNEVSPWREEGVWECEDGKLVWRHTLISLASVLRGLEPYVPLVYQGSDERYINYFSEKVDIGKRQWDSVRRQYNRLKNGTASLPQKEQEYLAEQVEMIARCLGLQL